MSLSSNISALATRIATEFKNGIIRGKSAQQYKLISGTIRRVDATTWEIISDANHAATNIGTLQILSSPFRLRVNYGFTAVKVSSFQVTPDEAFSKAALRVGASVGLSYADLYFYLGAAGSTETDPGLLSTAGANIWITGVMEV